MTAYQYDDGCRLLIFQRADTECRALEAYYAGIRFNQVRLLFLPALALQDSPDREDIKPTFNVSGSAVDLVRHGFALADWLAPIRARAQGYETVGFGGAWRRTRTRQGFRLQGARYEDGMTKLTLALAPMLLTPQLKSSNVIWRISP